MAEQSGFNVEEKRRAFRIALAKAVVGDIPVLRTMADYMHSLLPETNVGSEQEELVWAIDTRIEELERADMLDTLSKLSGKTARLYVLGEDQGLVKLWSDDSYGRRNIRCTPCDELGLPLRNDSKYMESGELKIRSVDIQIRLA